jgi:diguanylate cyclase (GGDEF)-like protein/PAS domain S-box-containing protein
MSKQPWRRPDRAGGRHQPADAPIRLGRGRLAVLAVASLLPPAVLVFQALLGEPVTPLVAAGTGVLCLIVMARVHWLLLRVAAYTQGLQRRRDRARFRALSQHASDVLLIVGAEGEIIWQSPSTQRVLGWTGEQLAGRSLTGLVHPDDHAAAQDDWNRVSARPGAGAPATWRLRHRDGGWRQTEVICNNLLSEPDVAGIVVTIRDVSERAELERRLAHHALHDGLTGLANRTLLRERVQHAAERQSRLERSMAVLLLDFDDFRVVNDSLGPTAGDDLLRAAAARISGMLRPGDTAARLDGDEFAILLEEISDASEAVGMAERVGASLEAPFPVGGRSVAVQASIGLAVLGPDGPDGDDLLRAADIALATAKAEGKNRVELYRASRHATEFDRLERRAELERAVERKEFVLRYQPIVDLGGDRVVGVEALIRWEHPDRGLLGPGEFIDLAETTGLIVPIGDWVLAEACRQAKAWETEFHRTIRMSVNLSARQFQQPGLAARVARVLDVVGLDPASLVLELTETMLVHDTETMLTTLAELKKLGLALAIDDFGTGYSSLSYLRRFPIDILKIDKAFVDEVSTGVEQAALAEAIVRLGQTLHLQTVAEGIETEHQAQALVELGCHYGQGYLFARPMPAEDIRALLAASVSPANQGRRLRAGVGLS